MKIEITITSESANILAAAIVAAVGGGSANTTSEPTTSTPAKPVKAPKAEKPAPPAVTLDNLRASATKVVDSGKKVILITEILVKHFGVKKITELKPEQYAEAQGLFEELAAAPTEDDPMA